MSTSFLPVTNKITTRSLTNPSSIPTMMLVDMNSFFASVEQQANPRFRGRPLGVVASMHPTSCIIAASKEAKTLGITTGTLIYKAQKICPGIILTESEPMKYREVSRRVNEIFQSYTDRVEPYSIDESFLDLSQQRLNPLAVGAEIKQRIRDEVGEYLTCSVGIASNKFMGKLAADMKKPDGLTVVWREHLPQIYQRLRFTDLWGVARGWEKRLNRIGITSPLQMLNYPVSNLLAVFGKPGFYIWQRINGLEQDEVNPLEDDPKSFGHSWVLNFRTTDKSKLAVVIMRLAEKAARRMRDKGFKASGIYLSVTEASGKYFHISRKLNHPINTGQELYNHALNLWKTWQFELPIMHIATGFTRLTSDCLQLDLFGNKLPDLVAAIDQINNRYGEFTIRSGILTHTQDFAPDAIAFGK